MTVSCLINWSIEWSPVYFISTVQDHKSKRLSGLYKLQRTTSSVCRPSMWERRSINLNGNTKVIGRHRKDFKMGVMCALHLVLPISSQAVRFSINSNWFMAECLRALWYTAEILLSQPDNECCDNIPESVQVTAAVTQRGAHGDE